MKVRIYLETFIVYMLMNSTRAVYSFSKTYLKEDFELPKILLAIIDASLYFGLGIAFLIRYALNTNPKQTLKYTVYSVIAIIAFSLVPFLSFFNEKDKNHEVIQISIVILIFIYGFCQFKFLPACLSLVNNHFTTEEHGCILGFWSSSRSVGNIFGYLGASLLIVNLGIRWETTFFIYAGLLLVFTILVAFSLYDDEQQIAQGQKQNQQIIGCSQFWTYTKEQFCSLPFILFILKFCLLKSLMYTLLLWLPIYVESKGQQQDAALIANLFNVTSIIGSFVIGKFYESSGEKGSNKCLNIFMIILGFAIVGGIIEVIQMQTFSSVTFAIIVGVQGFGVGGIHNIFSGNQPLRINGGDKNKLIMFTNLINGVSNCFIGVTELVIGVFLGVSEESGSYQYDSIFVVLLCVASLLFILLSIRGCTQTAVESSPVSTDQIQQ